MDALRIESYIEIDRRMHMINVSEMNSLALTCAILIYTQTVINKAHCYVLYELSN